MIEDGRANFAYKLCYAQKNNGKYRTRVKDMPSMIQSNGLAGAVAFLFSKSGKDASYKDLYNDIEKWLYKQKLIDQISLMEALTKMDAMQYRRITTEVMALLKWMKRFVDGVASDGSEPGN